MSSFKNFAPMLSSLQAQADGTGTIAGSAIEDFLSIAGYETPGGGGGGGDDFTIANVELTYYEADKEFFTCPACNEVGFTGVPELSFVFMPGTSGTFKVPLYKGTCVWMLPIEDVGNISVTGNIRIYDEDNILIITGDGTITVTE